MGLEREISRTVSFKTSRGKAMRGSLQRVTRRLVVFEIYDPFLVLRTSEVLSAFQVRRGRDSLYQGDAVVTNVVNTTSLQIVSATLTGDWTGLETVSLDKIDMGQEAAAFIGEWNRHHLIAPNYQLCVANLRAFLIDMRHWLDQIDLARDDEATSEVRRSSLSDAEFESVVQKMLPQLTQLCMALETAIREVDPAAIDTHKTYAQRELLPVLMPSPFFNRIYSKPLGYAGDYEMVNMMFFNAPGGLTTNARVVDAWMLAGGPAEAHRNRIAVLKSILHEIALLAATKNRPLRILNIGCGPAHELQLFLSETGLAHKLQIDLLDFNAETLAFTRSQLEPLADAAAEKPDISYALKSVQDLLRQAIERTAVEEPYDFVYCAGLFDYLTDRVCAKLVRLFFDWCGPGGRVLVTNVHAQNPVKGLMEHVMEWHLVLRDETGMMRLSPDAANSKVYTDSTGINVFLDVRKPF